MSLVIVHLRWDDVGADQYAEVCRALPDGDRLPPGCLSRELRLEGRVLHGTEVWAALEPAEHALHELPDTVSALRAYLHPVIRQAALQQMDLPDTP